MEGGGLIECMRMGENYSTKTNKPWRATTVERGASDDTIRLEGFLSTITTAITNKMKYCTIDQKDIVYYNKL
jgi:hypothetical protein